MDPTELGRGRLSETNTSSAYLSVQYKARAPWIPTINTDINNSKTRKQMALLPEGLQQT